MRSVTRLVNPIQSTLMSANSRLSQTTRWITSTPVPETQDILCQNNLAVRNIILNRPKKLNALNLPMVQAMLPKAWEKSDLAKIILLKSSGGKGFCAGGDVKSVVDLVDANDSSAAKFFEIEYQLDHFIATLEKPFVSLMDGITMGGGVGLSVHAPFRVATENTMFAMPETAIGFLPDVGGSFFLPRLDGELGVYLGMTGYRLKAVDVLYAGIATHYVPSSRLEALEKRLSEIDNPTHDIVNTAIEEFSAELDQEPNFSMAGDIRSAIDRQYDTVEEIIGSLEKEDSAWGAATLKLLNKMSPTSLKVTLQQLRNGASLSIAQSFKMEFHLVQKFFEGNDFKEGVNSTLVTRTPPKWNPGSLEQVDLAKIRNDYFNASSSAHLGLLTTKDFKQYPHRKFMLPSESDIKRVVTGEAPDVGNYALNREEVIEYFLKDRRNKQGVKQKVAEVLDRKTRILGKGDSKSLKWSY
ncbi:ClpP/crotonase-like domain-containing protein [Phycomyces nitens]|nr:ClpP/crotonase-like domain-containing protein [Phycomyces nitens]